MEHISKYVKMLNVTYLPTCENMLFIHVCIHMQDAHHMCIEIYVFFMPTCGYMHMLVHVYTYKPHVHLCVCLFSCYVNTYICTHAAFLHVHTMCTYFFHTSAGHISTCIHMCPCTQATYALIHAHTRIFTCVHTHTHFSVVSFLVLLGLFFMIPSRHKLLANFNQSNHLQFHSFSI
jgi:hypothetical protein